MKNKHAVPLIALGLVGLAIVAKKRAHMWTRWDGPEGNMTPEQRQAWARHRLEKMKELAPLWAQLKAKKLELEALWMKEDPTEEEILTAGREISALEQQLMEKKLRWRLAGRKLLPPELRWKMQMMHHEAPCCGGKMGFMHRMGGHHMGLWEHCRSEGES